MNIVFDKHIFVYLCLFYSLIKYFHEFQSIFVNVRFTDIFVKIFTDISVKSKYPYIRNYRYFIPCVWVISILPLGNKHETCLFEIFHTHLLIFRII